MIVTEYHISQLCSLLPLGLRCTWSAGNNRHRLSDQRHVFFLELALCTTHRGAQRESWSRVRQVGGRPNYAFFGNDRPFGRKAVPRPGGTAALRCQRANLIKDKLNLLAEVTAVIEPSLEGFAERGHAELRCQKGRDV